MIIELTRVDAFIHGLLTGDSALMALASGVHSESAPQSAVPPYVIFGTQDEGMDTKTVGATHVMAQPLYLVKGITEGRTWQGTSKSIADRIVSVLDRTEGVSDDGRIIGCVRERAFRLVEQADGVEYRHQGALFRVWVKEE